MFSRGSSTKSASGLPPAAQAARQLQNAGAASGGGPASACADCGAAAPTWASLNRGVLLCADCTSVHRSLGRHVSQVRCLRAGHWIPEQLAMVQGLYACGANSIWEYSLLNPSVTSSKGSSGKQQQRGKPSAADPLHPVKSDFISAKYQQTSFVYRPGKDEPAVGESELSRQLHSSVRTPNLETSLRLISQGADPNYFHPEKNSTPLQVAAKAGQSCQVELLLVHGADPGAVDKNGRTAVDYAKTSGHGGLASRIFASQFELSDRLSYFLCQRRPDHTTDSHFLVPEVDENPQMRSSEDRRVAKRKLQGLNNAVFEELAMDVYDEVDRRETDEVWAKLVSGPTAKAVITPFLPVNPHYGTTRNQGRQKLARLSRHEFNVLVLDVLKEIRRRQLDMNARTNPSSNNPNMHSPLRESPGHLRGISKLGQTKSLPVSQGVVGACSDDEPIYDHVASDDDYYHIPESEEEPVANKGGPTPRRPHSSSGPSTSTATTNSVNSSPSKSSSSRHKAQQHQLVSPSLRQSEYCELRQQLESSEVKVQRLIESNDDMRGEIARLSATVNRLVCENEHLKKSLSPTHSAYNNANSGGSTSNLIRGNDGGIPFADGNGSNRGSPVPNRTFFNNSGAPGPTPPPAPNYMTLPNRLLSGGSAGNRGSGGHMTNQQQPQQMYDDFDFVPQHHPLQQQHSTSSLPYALQQSSSFSANHPPPPPPAPAPHHEYMEPTLSRPSTTTTTSSSSNDTSSAPLLPSQEEVVRRTEAITRCIQELLVSAKDERFDAFIPCSERIVRAVTDMVVHFPEEPLDAGVSAALSSLTAAATHFETECRVLIVRSKKGESLNQGFVTQQVIQCAFDIAKATKQLVALFQ